LRIGQQIQQARIDPGALPGEGEGIRHHIGDQPARIARLQRFDVVHQQAHTALAVDPGQPRAQAMAERYSATQTARCSRAARDEGLQAFRQALVAQTGYGMGHGSTRD